MRTGQIKITIDSAEHPQMKDKFEDANKNIGGILDIGVKTLRVGDYIIKPEGERGIIITFKTVNDFKASFWNGHLMDEVFGIYVDGEYENYVKALIIADEVCTDSDTRAWVDAHWRKRNFIIPTFRFENRDEAVEFMVDMAMTVDRLNWVDRSVHMKDDYNQVVGIYKFYGVGEDKARLLADKFPKPILLFTNMATGRDYDSYKERAKEMGVKMTKKMWREERWWHGIMGEKKAVQIENLILDGVDIPKVRRGIDKDSPTQERHQRIIRNNGQDNIPEGVGNH